MAGTFAAFGAKIPKKIKKPAKLSLVCQMHWLVLSEEVLAPVNLVGLSKVSKQLSAEGQLNELGGQVSKDVQRELDRLKPVMGKVQRWLDSICNVVATGGLPHLLSLGGIGKRVNGRKFACNRDTLLRKLDLLQRIRWMTLDQEKILTAAFEQITGLAQQADKGHAGLPKRSNRGAGLPQPSQSSKQPLTERTNSFHNSVVDIAALRKASVVVGSGNRQAMTQSCRAEVLQQGVVAPTTPLACG